jgi:hypothetical protein
MTPPAERMRKLRRSRQARGLRELRIVVPDARRTITKRRIAAEIARLDSEAESEALEWIEAVSEFDADATR